MAGLVLDDIGISWAASGKARQINNSGILRTEPPRREANQYSVVGRTVSLVVPPASSVVDSFWKTSTTENTEVGFISWGGRRGCWCRRRLLRTPSRSQTAWDEDEW